MERRQQLAEELVNQRFEYEVQATNGTEHDFPQIAQGLAEETKKKLQEYEARWRGDLSP